MGVPKINFNSNYIHISPSQNSSKPCIITTQMSALKGNKQQLKFVSRKLMSLTTAMNDLI